VCVYEIECENLKQEILILTAAETRDRLVKCDQIGHTLKFLCLQIYAYLYSCLRCLSVSVGFLFCRGRLICLRLCSTADFRRYSRARIKELWLGLCRSAVQEGQFHFHTHFHISDSDDEAVEDEALRIVCKGENVCDKCM
jgi:hypothetical protein